MAVELRLFEYQINEFAAMAYGRINKCVYSQKLSYVDSAVSKEVHFMQCHPKVSAWMRFAKFEMKNREIDVAMYCYTREVDDAKAEMQSKNFQTDMKTLNLSEFCSTEESETWVITLDPTAAKAVFDEVDVSSTAGVPMVSIFLLTKNIPKGRSEPNVLKGRLKWMLRFVELNWAVKNEKLKMLENVLETYSLTLQHEQTASQILRVKLGAKDLWTQDASTWLKDVESKAQMHQEAVDTGVPKPYVPKGITPTLPATQNTPKGSRARGSAMFMNFFMDLFATYHSLASRVTKKLISSQSESSAFGIATRKHKQLVKGFDVSLFHTQFDVKCYCRITKLPKGIG